MKTDVRAKGTAAVGSARRRLGVAGLALVALLGGAATSRAGIIVLETGDTIVGRIDAKDVTRDKVTVRWPYGDARAKGQLDVQRARIRWMDVDADAPTDAYWREHLDKPIEVRWASAREAYRVRTRAVAPNELPIPVDPIQPDSIGVLIEQPDYELRKPIDWEATVERTPDGVITMLVAPHGTRARIHVFAVDSPPAERTEQLDWIKSTLEHMAGEGGPEGTFEVEELYRLKQVPGGADQLMVTTTRRGARVVRALRKVLFREGRTVFFAAYADARDYAAVEETFHRVLGTLRFKASP